MLPIRHTGILSITPKVNRGLVAANVVAFLGMLLLGPLTERIIITFGFVPARFTSPAEFHYLPWEVGVTLFTSLFLHGGFVHLSGNLLYLWVFGSAVEEEMGHARYFFFFLACGAVGSLTHTFFFRDSLVPSIGASGSIAGVLGAFLILKPRAQVITLIPLLVWWAMAEIPAILFMPIWFGTQFFNGFLSLSAARATQEIAGVAWWAHVGGFVFGALVAWIMRLAAPRPAPLRR